MLGCKTGLTRSIKHISGCKFNCYFIMPRCMCVKNLRVISAFLHIYLEQ